MLCIFYLWGFLHDSYFCLYLIFTDSSVFCSRLVDTLTTDLRNMNALAKVLFLAIYFTYKTSIINI